MEIIKKLHFITDNIQLPAILTFIWHAELYFDGGAGILTNGMTTVSALMIYHILMYTTLIILCTNFITLIILQMREKK